MIDKRAGSRGTGERFVVAANDAFLKRFELRTEDVVGRRCDSLTPEGVSFCSDGDNCLAATCLEDGQVQMAIRSRTTKQGELRQEEVRISPIQADDDSISHCVEVWRDITDRRSAEARWAEAQRLASLGMLASGFSHEVNTPLASIRTCLDGLDRMLSEGAGELGEMARLVKIAAEQVARCGSITEQFLRLARGQELSLEVVDLARVVDEVVRLVGPTARERGIELVVEPKGAKPKVLAHPSALHQVLMNLLLNAIEASSDGQAVKLALLDDEGPVIRVTDAGKGIPPEDRSRLFEPFFSRKQSGTGLGLFVSLNFARGWGGDILVENADGGGSVFSLTFPVDRSGTES